MTGWFGKSWGAPCCDPETHVLTPVGSICWRCDERIAKDDQGVTMPFVPAEGSVDFLHAHLDCYLKTILPHGPDCPHCRGKERAQHHERCAYRAHGDDCNCVALEDV
jgi:hypothetical protein